MLTFNYEFMFTWCCERFVANIFKSVDGSSVAVIYFDI